MLPSVIIVSSEAVPFSKTGGLADVSGALAVALKRAGCKAALFLPFYRETALGGFEIENTGLTVKAPLAGRVITAEVLRTSHEGVPVYFIRCDEFFDRTYLYGTPERDYFDNLERFTFFSRGVIEALKARGFAPDIIHCNDWQTGLVPACIKDIYGLDPHFTNTKTVFTIHNIAYQGIFPQNGFFALTGLSERLYASDGMEFWGKLSLLKAGLVYSDAITTVSRTYSEEIQTIESGCGLDGVLRERKAVLHGVLNGVDYDEWNPETDKLIPTNFSVRFMSGKAECRKALLKEFGLKAKVSTPVIAMITRLAEQKGFDILLDAMSKLMDADVALLILGSGEARYRLLLEEAALRYPKKLSVKIAFDKRLAHLVEAGADIFLMPSRYEPCGLNQIYSLKYGTIPIVRATGGLEDTVKDYSIGKGTGFKFKDYSANALIDKVSEACSVFKDKKEWGALQKRAMSEEFSWERAAGEYIGIYQTIVGSTPKT
ncbi:MAG: glycogen synthase GlgA [Deltaproteobacteria bacterium]|nr:glycogen synthase GlgA [Deltaproteobacteria bacterium]